MGKKDFLIELGERNTETGGVDALLGDTITESRRKRIRREEEEAQAEHEAKMAKLKKETKTADGAVEKTVEKRETESPVKFEVKGGVNLGTIDFDAERKAATEELKKLKQEQEANIAALGHENQQLRDQIHEKELKVLAAEFKTEIDGIKSRGSLTDQITAIKTLAKELGLAAPDPGVKDPSIQIRMLELEHAEAQRDREFQWTMQKHKEELELQREELKDKREAANAENARQSKRDEMFAKGPEVLGRAIGRAIAESGAAGDEEGASVTKQVGFEAALGESGQVECVKCHQPVAIGSTATRAQCASCGATYPVRRVSPQPAPTPAEKPAEEEE